MDRTTKPPSFPCPHNDGVECATSQRKCARCGWNPAVAKARSEKLGIALAADKKKEE